MFSRILLFNGFNQVRILFREGKKDVSIETFNINNSGPFYNDILLILEYLQMKTLDESTTLFLLGSKFKSITQTDYES